MERETTPDPETVACAAEQITSSSEDERDVLLTDLLCRVYGTLAGQNG